jgi:hypothetical protein
MKMDKALRETRCVPNVFLMFSKALSIVSFFCEHGQGTPRDQATHLQKKNPPWCLHMACVPNVFLTCS